MTLFIFATVFYVKRYVFLCSFVVKNFLINGGGGGGFHYDEDLGRNTPIAGWDVASYLEDSRGDL